MIYDEDDGFLGWLRERGSPFDPWIKWWDAISTIGSINQGYA